MDGSCYWDSWNLLATAWLAAIQVDQRGEVACAVLESISRTLPQTAAASEHVAVLLSASHAHGLPALAADCASVVTSWARGRSFATAPAIPFAAVWRQLHAKSFLGQVRKSKAHRGEEHAANAEELREIRGNNHADRLAKQKGLRGARPEAEVIAHDQAAKRAVAIAIVFGRILAEWPNAREVYGELAVARPARGGRARRAPHAWHWDAKIWQCVQCFRRKRHPRSTADAMPCAGLPAKLLELVEKTVGHKLWTLPQPHGAVIVFRIARGCYTAGTVRRLALPCYGGPRDAGLKARLARLRGGKHPVSGMHLEAPWRLPRAPQPREEDVPAAPVGAVQALSDAPSASVSALPASVRNIQHELDDQDYVDPFMWDEDFA